MDEESYISGMLDRTLLFYDRNAIEKVRNTVFAISGLGGVGAITAELLARWGVKRFRLLDKDKYEPSNLNRQLFATSKTLGRYKVDVTAERILEINPFSQIEMILKSPVDNENVHRFVRGAGMVIQSADSPSCQLFYRAAKEHKVPLVNGYSTITGCRVQVYDYRNLNWWYKLEACWQKFKNRRRKDLEQMNIEELGKFDQEIMHPTMPTVNFVTNIIGCMMVGEGIKLITATGKCAKFPKCLEFDFYKNKVTVKNVFSPLEKDNFIKLFSNNSSRDRFDNLVKNAKTGARTQNK